MTQYGWTDQGWVLKPQNAILADIKARLNAIADPVTGQTMNITNPDDPRIQEINAISDAIAQVWQEAQYAVNQFDPLRATGAGLSGLVQLNGLTRTGGTYATIVVDLTGTPNAIIAMGQQIIDPTNTWTFVLPSWSFDNNGNAIVTAQCTETGITSLSIGTGLAMKILTPQSGWRTATATAISDGVAEESDTVLRERRNQSTETTSSNNLLALYGALRNITGVTFVKIYTNSSLSMDSRGIPGKTIAPIVVGGDDQEVADVIFAKTSIIDCNTFGSTTVTIVDQYYSDISYPIGFTRPAIIPIYVAILGTVINPAIWPSNGSQLIKEAVVAYSQGGAPAIGIDTGQGWQAGYTPGQTVYASDLFFPVTSVAGINIAGIAVGSAPNPVESSVIINWKQLALFSIANITVTVN